MAKRPDHNQDLTIPRKPTLVGKFRIYPRAGYCIYCGISSRLLTDEHIIPVALGGNVLLPAASCGVCQNIINQQFETPILNVMHGSFGTARISLKIPPRRGHLKRTHVKLTIIDDDGAKRDLEVPNDDVPLLIVGLSTENYQPGILSGRQPTKEHKGNIWVCYNTEKAEQFMKPGESLEGLGTVNPLQLFRLVAKIAHGFAHATYGDKFDPFLNELILGRSEIVEHFISSSSNELPDMRGLHSTAVGLLKPDQKYVVAYIRLFCRYRAPTYMVVVGERRGTLQEFHPI